MNKRICIFILSIILILNTILSQKVYAEDKKNIIRVGVFALEPYAYLNSDGEIDGYYIQLFDLIAERMNVEVQYILSDLKDWVTNLENGEVDIVLGASITEENLEKYIFNKHSIALESFAIYSTANIDSGNFENLDGLRFGYVEESQKSKWIFNFFKSISVDVVPVAASSYFELEELMDNNEIDLMIDSAYSNNKHKKIYEFLGNQVFIAANKGNQDLLDRIDGAISYYGKEDRKLITKLYNSYFDEDQIMLDRRINILRWSLIIIFVIFFIIYIIPNLRKILKQKKISNRLKNNRYLLYYQPIYDSIKEEIVGFEGLLRLKDKHDKLISPANFIPEIEKNNMLFDVTIWILKKVIIDYKEIRKYSCINDDNFYISLNLSIDEIQNNKFVDKAIEILKESELENKSICLEIVERVGIKDLHKIINNIYRLKKAGFKIAIDDFGTEYSNLDVLEKLDADIIKVDKNFVDGLGKHLIKNETILFILRVAEKEEKSVVLEGIEDKEQDNIIKGFNSKNVFVQGYFYNKPMEKDKIKAL